MGNVKKKKILPFIFYEEFKGKFQGKWNAIPKIGYSAIED